MVKHIYTSVDIGSDAIKVVVFELFKNKLNLLAASSVKSKGVRKGLIVDFENAADTLKRGIAEVEQMLGIKIKKVVASVPSYYSDYIKVNSEVPINNEQKVVTSSEIVSSFEVCTKEHLAPNREMVTVVPIDFQVDNGELVRNPKGSTGDILKTRAILVTTPAKNIYSVVNLIEHIGIEVVDISLNDIGNIQTFKGQTMDKKVGAIVDIGSEITSITLYNKGIAVKNAIIQYGGKNIDNDIAYMYKIDGEVAQRLKEQFAVAHKKSASASEFREVIDLNGDKKKINQLELSEIVMSRVEEIFGLIKEQIEALSSKKLEYVILTGGSSNLPQIKAVASEVLGDDVILGNIKVVGVRNNKYSAAIGNVIYFINRLKLQGNNYSMTTEEDINASSDKGHTNSNETMLGKVFGYFFGE